MHNPISRRRFLKQSSTTIASVAASLASKNSVGQASGKPGSKTSANELIADLSAFIPPLLTKHRVPGLAIALIQDAEVIWSRGFGSKSVATKEPVSADTVFEAASLSKPAFAYVALKLCDEGQLGLDTPLAEYLSQPLIPNEPRLKQITLRTVLAHNSGLPHGRPAGTPIALRFTPGQQFYYSATGFQYAQMVVERLTNRSLAALMKTRLLDPFGMPNSSFGWLDKFEKQAAAGHDKDGEQEPTGNGQYLEYTPEERAQAEKDFPEWKYPSASAGLYTTAADYAKFMIEILQPAKKSPFHLSEKMTAEMLKPQVKVTAAISWGLGWGREQTDVGEAFWHWGDWGVFRNFALAFKERKSGVVILTNSFHGPKVYREIVPRAMGGDHPAFAWVNGYRP